MRKKYILIMTLFIITLTNINNIKAIEIKPDLSSYYLVINRINEKYGSQLVIYNELEFMNSEIASDYNFDYQKYINQIISTDLVKFEEECTNIATYQIDDFDVNIRKYTLSTLSTQTVKFNSSRNSMTLTYKHNGSKYDTSYKPGVKVNKLSSTYYFKMSSYTGSFKNNNTTYTVNAKGSIHTSFGVSNGKTFTVNFNL